MSTIHFVGGEKGGVGKSLFSRVLSQFFLDNSMPYVGIDADQSHSTLGRYYNDYTQTIQLDKYESVDQIMELAVLGKERAQPKQLLIDLPAQSEKLLNSWVDDNNVLDMCKELDLKLVYWYVVDAGEDSKQLLRNFIAQHREELSIVVVRNYGRGNVFSAIDGVVSQANAEKKLNIKALNFPALHGNTIHKIDKLGLSFWAAIHLKESSPKHLSLMERQRTRVWLDKCYQTIHEAIQLPEKVTETEPA